MGWSYSPGREKILIGNSLEDLEILGEWVMRIRGG